MKRLFLGMAFLVLGILCSSKANAVPLDVPYGILYDTVTITTANVPIIFSTTTLPITNFVNLPPNAPVNSSSQWCMDNLVISMPSTSSNGTFTLYNSSGSMTSGTTDYAFVVTSTGTPYTSPFPYRQPHCAPRGNQWNMQFSVSGATVTYEIYSFKGWNP